MYTRGSNFMQPAVLPALEALYSKSVRHLLHFAAINSHPLWAILSASDCAHPQCEDSRAETYSG